MKKMFATVLSVLLCILLCTTAYAETADSIKVFVTIADADGKLAIANEAIAVTDADEDGALTINDALIAAHDAKFNGGAEEGYAFSMGAYGLQMDKLWGAENGTGYGYYVNNASATGLGDVIKAGDYVSAFVYTDTTNWSDTYCYFDSSKAALEAEQSISLVLLAAGFDANWNPITVPVEGAVITVNGEPTEVKTNAEGKATVMLKNSGTHVISAVSDTQTLVPPACTVTVTAKPAASTPTDTDDAPATGGETGIVFWTLLFGASLIGMITLVVRSKKSYEK